MLLRCSESKRTNISKSLRQYFALMDAHFKSFLLAAAYCMIIFILVKPVGSEQSKQENLARSSISHLNNNVDVNASNDLQAELNANEIDNFTSTWNGSQVIGEVSNTSSWSVNETLGLDKLRNASFSRNESFTADELRIISLSANNSFGIDELGNASSTANETFSSEELENVGTIAVGNITVDETNENETLTTSGDVSIEGTRKVSDNADNGKSNSDENGTTSLTASSIAPTSAAGISVESKIPDGSKISSGENIPSEKNVPSETESSSGNKTPSESEISNENSNPSESKISSSVVVPISNTDKRRKLPNAASSIPKRTLVVLLGFIIILM